MALEGTLDEQQMRKMLIVAQAYQQDADDTFVRAEREFARVKTVAEEKRASAKDLVTQVQDAIRTGSRAFDPPTRYVILKRGDLDETIIAGYRSLMDGLKNQSATDLVVVRADYVESTRWRKRFMPETFVDQTTELKSALYVLRGARDLEFGESRVVIVADAFAEVNENDTPDTIRRVDSYWNREWRAIIHPMTVERTGDTWVFRPYDAPWGRDDIVTVALGEDAHRLAENTVGALQYALALKEMAFLPLPPACGEAIAEHEHQERVRLLETLMQGYFAVTIAPPEHARHHIHSLHNAYVSACNQKLSEYPDAIELRPGVQVRPNRMMTGVRNVLREHDALPTD